MRFQQNETLHLSTRLKPEFVYFTESFTSLYTPDIYQYCFVPEVAIDNSTFLTFMIKAKADAHMALSATLGDLSKRSIEILIGAEGNRKSFIKDGLGGAVRSEALTINILSEQVRLSHVMHIYIICVLVSVVIWPAYIHVR